ncbi:MAG: hypothetical protein ACFFEE_08345 [Candidatus Thorarchaeota archaeon]
MGTARSIASITGTAIGSGSKLLVKVWWSLRRGKGQVKKGAKTFYNALVKAGIPREDAKEITLAYAQPAWELLSIRGVFRLIRELDESNDIPSLPFGF